MVYIAWFLYSSGYLITGIVLLFIMKKVFDILTPYSVDVQLTEKDNPALGVLLMSYLAGGLAVLCGTFAGETTGVPTWQLFVNEIVPTIITGLLGMILLFIAGIINDKIILRRFSNQKEIIENHNTAVALVMGASYIGSGIIIAGGVYGSISFVTFLAAFAAGQIMLNLFAVFYKMLTKYNDQEELEKKNNAAGFAFAGNIIAYSIILMKGVQAPNVSWSWLDRLEQFGYYAVAGFVLLLISRIIADKIFIPGKKLKDEIVEDQNINVGLLEGGLAISMGLILGFCL